MEYYTADTFESEHVRITPTGLYDVKWIPDKQRRKGKGRQGRWAVKRVKKTLVLRKLRNYCLIENKTTFLDIINMVDQYKLLKFFIAQYSWCGGIEQFIAQAREPRKESTRDIDRLEIYRRAMTEPYFDNSSEFHGVGIRVDWNGEPITDESLPRNQGYSVSCSPLNEIAHLEVVLDETQEIYAKGEEYNAKPTFVGKNIFTLLEVLDAIFDDISFHGPTPEHNAAFLSEMSDTIANLKDMTEEELKANTIPLEDLFKEEEDEQQNPDSGQRPSGQ